MLLSKGISYRHLGRRGIQEGRKVGGRELNIRERMNSSLYNDRTQKPMAGLQSAPRPNKSSSWQEECVWVRKLTWPSIIHQYNKLPSYNYVMIVRIRRNPRYYALWDSPVIRAAKLTTWGVGPDFRILWHFETVQPHVHLLWQLWAHLLWQLWALEQILVKKNPRYLRTLTQTPYICKLGPYMYKYSTYGGSHISTLSTTKSVTKGGLSMLVQNLCLQSFAGCLGKSQIEGASQRVVDQAN